MLSGSAQAGPRFAKEWLSHVSRTFALSIRVLPPPLEETVRLAYLFCRVADTVEDDRVLPATERIALLELFSACFLPEPDLSAVARFRDRLPESWRTSPEDDQFLSWHCEAVFQEYARLPVAARRTIDGRVQEMCRGMAAYAARRDESGWFFLDTVAELRDYCYYVAGVVGLMLCDLFAWHEPSISPTRLKLMNSRAVGFGLALQLVNIARDVPADHLRQTVFVPQELWRRYGLDAQSALDSEKREAGTQALRELLIMTQKEVEIAQAYILKLPRRAYRIRLFCLWPLLMSQDTLVKLGEHLADVLDPSQRIKIGRRDVRRIMATTALCASSNLLVGGMFRRRNRRFQRLLDNL